MAKFEEVKKRLSTDFTEARLDLSAMAVAYSEVAEKPLSEVVAFYMEKLEYTLKEAVKVHNENKKAFMFMTISGFSQDELEAMASTIR